MINAKMMQYIVVVILGLIVLSYLGILPGSLTGAGITITAPSVYEGEDVEITVGGSRGGNDHLDMSIWVDDAFLCCKGANTFGLVTCTKNKPSLGMHRVTVYAAQYDSIALREGACSEHEAYKNMNLLTKSGVAGIAESNWVALDTKSTTFTVSKRPAGQVSPQDVITTIPTTISGSGPSGVTTTTIQDTGGMTIIERIDVWIANLIARIFGR